MFDTIRTLETLKTDADIAIYYHGSRTYGTKEWVVKLEKESDGTKLEIRVEAETLDEAVAQLNSKFRKATSQGLRELDLPVLEYHRSDHEPEPDPPEIPEPLDQVMDAESDPDDDIPF